jgi:hypothetical protein
MEPIPGDSVLGPLEPIEEGREDEEERKEGPTLQTKQKPARQLQHQRLRWLRDRLLAHQNRRRNELQLLLPPKVSYGVYAIGWLFIALCFYMIILHGLKFSEALEVAWMIATVVSIVQELLIQQMMGLAFRSAFRQLFIPSVTRTFVATEEGSGLARVSEMGDPTHPQARLKKVKKPRQVARQAGDIGDGATSTPDSQLFTQLMPAP